MKKTVKPNFGLRMAALRQARKELAAKDLKNKELTADYFKPLDPLDQQVTASLTMKPLEVTAPTPNSDQKIEVQVSTAMERAVQRLRDQATKIQS